MRSYLARRVVVGLFVILSVTVLAFASTQLIPADVVDFMLGKHATPEAGAALRHRLGLDRPAPVRYLEWLGGLLRGDLGESIRTQEPVIDALRQRLPVTIELAFLATLIAMAIGIPAGIIVGVRQYSVADKVSTAVAMLGLSIPDFWLATLLILVLSITWKLLPPGGRLPSLLEDPVNNLQRMVMPALSLGLPSAAVYFRMTRSSMLEVIRADYMVTAYSKGLSERRAVLVHALRNAIIPVVTITGLEVTWMLGGSFIIETIFSLLGLGMGTVQAIYEREYIVLQGFLLVYAFLVVMTSIGMDVVYAWLDPRIRFD